MDLFHLVPYFFFLYLSPSLSLYTVFDPVSSNIDEVSSINPSANVFVFGDYNYYKNWEKSEKRFLKTHSPRPPYCNN